MTKIRDGQIIIFLSDNYLIVNSFDKTSNIIIGTLKMTLTIRGYRRHVLSILTNSTMFGVHKHFNLGRNGVQFRRAIWPLDCGGCDSPQKSTMWIY